MDGPTDKPADGWTKPLIELLFATKKLILNFNKMVFELKIFFI